MTPSSEAHPWRRVAEYTLPSATGSTSLAIERVADAVQTLPLTEPLLTRLYRALVEIVDNCVAYDLRHPVRASIRLQINLSTHVLPVPVDPLVPPSWGFFFIERMVTVVSAIDQMNQHLIELYLYQESIG